MVASFARCNSTFSHKIYFQPPDKEITDQLIYTLIAHHLSVHLGILIVILRAKKRATSDVTLFNIDLFLINAENNQFIFLIHWRLILLTILIQ